MEDSPKFKIERPLKRQRLESGPGPPEQSSNLYGSTDSRPEELKRSGSGRHTKDAIDSEENVRKEAAVGISAYVNGDILGFSAVFKHRYTDFLVNEILPDGTTAHLTSLDPPGRMRKAAGKRKNGRAQSSAAQNGANIDGLDQAGDDELVAQDDSPAASSTSRSGVKHDEGSFGSLENGAGISGDDSQLLTSIFGKDLLQSIVTLHQSVINRANITGNDSPNVASKPITDRNARTAAHQAVRRIFGGKIDTKTADDGVITLLPATRNSRRGGNQSANHLKGKKGWVELGGDYCHFSLYKENKDTMEAVGYLAAQSKTHVKSFQFGGTKDRRAVTVQRVSAYRMTAEHLAKIGERLRGAYIGDFQYHPTALELGDLGGNEFCITLRDCVFPNDLYDDASQRQSAIRYQLDKDVASLTNRGFLNYYGLQRFGSFTRSTDTIGMKLLQGDLAGAVSDILYFPSDTILSPPTSFSSLPISSDDLARARAISTWLDTRNSDDALALLPRKFTAEGAIIRYLGVYDRHGEQSRLTDWQGALQTIPRPLRLMYAHAYQSRVWNAMTTARWRRGGATVLAGDLVLVEEHKDKVAPVQALPEVDELGEVIIRPAPEDSAKDAPGNYERARALTEEEVASGKYSIFDVVLPLPGYDVEYPANWMREEYKTFMASEVGGGLDPTNMRRKWKDVSLSGSYRKVLARPLPGMSVEVKIYTRAEEQLVKTDLDLLQCSRVGIERPEDARLTGGVDQSTANTTEEEKERLAVILRLRLGSSTYATMALRELMRSAGVVNFKPEFGGGR